MSPEASGEGTGATGGPEGQRGRVAGWLFGDWDYGGFLPMVECTARDQKLLEEPVSTAPSWPCSALRALPAVRASLYLILIALFGLTLHMVEVTS